MLARTRHGPIRSLRSGHRRARTGFRFAWRPPVICSPALLRRSGEQITSVRPAPLKLLRSVSYLFASLRIFLSLRSIRLTCRSASYCALADSARLALVPRSARTESAAAPAFASLTTSKRCARPHSTRGDPLPPETTTCPALVPRSGQVVVSSGRPSARPSACSHQFRSAWRPPVICSPILLRRSGEQITSVRPATLKLLRSVFYPFASLRFFVSLRSSASCRSVSSCALADSV